MGASPSLPAMGTWAAPTRRAKISQTARTAPSARSGRESRAVTAGIEEHGVGRWVNASGRIEIGVEEGQGFVVRAMDHGKGRMVFND